MRTITITIIFSCLLAMSTLAKEAQKLTLQEKIDAKKKANAKNLPPAKKKAFAEFSRAIKELKATGIEERALAQGMPVPNFNIAGKPFSYYYKKSPVILKFYRGHWCPTCMTELQEYQALQKTIKDKGAQFIALVPDLKRYINRTKKRFNFTFPIYRDEDNQIAKKFGLAFTLDKKVIEFYRDFKISLPESHGNNKQEIPMPGTYVINRQGLIVFAYFNADPAKRADPQTVLKALKQQ